ncbi:hypothetical protein BCT45_05150 [Vibrio breoganii]|nr:hypothetical protein BCT45_05150 [Vibrio breoganii]
MGNLKYKKDEEGYLPQLFDSFSGDLRNEFQRESDNEMKTLKEAQTNVGNILTMAELEPLGAIVSKELKMLGFDKNDIFKFHFFEGIPLTLSKYLLVKGTIEHDAELLALAGELDVVLGIGYAASQGGSISIENGIQLYIKGASRSLLYNYKSINRREPFEEANLPAKEEKQRNFNLVKSKALLIWKDSPSFTKSKVAKILVQDPEIEVSHSTIKRYLKRIPKPS